MEYLYEFVIFFKDMQAANAIVFVILAAFAWSLTYYLPQYVSLQKARLKQEEKRQEIIQKQNDLINNNTTVIHMLKSSFDTLSAVTEKISDSFSKHDASSEERSLRIIANLESQASVLNNLIEKVAKEDNIVKLNGRLDKAILNFAKKDDIDQIYSSLNDVGHDLDKVKEIVVEIKGRLEK